LSKNRLLVVVIGASLIALLACGAGAALLLFPPLIGEPLTVDETVSASSLFALGLGLGAPLSLTALGAYRGHSSRRFRIRWIWLGLPLLVITILAGHLILQRDLAPSLLLPLFHLLGIAIPPLLIVGAIAGHLAKAGLGIRWRELLGHLGAGAFVATFGSLVLEAIGFAGTVFLIALSPGGLEWLRQAWQDIQNSPIGLNDPDTVAELLGSPWGILAALLTVGVIAPLVEETLKPWAAVALSGRRSHAGRVFLWGVAAGAGFSLTEALLNAPTAADEWGVNVAARIGATAMHCLASGLVAWGWARQRGGLGRRHWVVLPLAYLGAMGLHSLWNSSIVGLGALSAQYDLESPENIPLTVALAVLGLMGLWGLLLILAPALLLGFTYRFGKQVRHASALREGDTKTPSAGSEFAATERAEDVGYHDV